MLSIVFERFSQEARQVVVAAQEEALGLRHNYIGTEHILLGCFSNTERGAGAALTALGLDADRVREDVRRRVGPGDESPSGQIPFTPRSKKALELALREAQSLGQPHIESLHLLLGMIRDKEGVATQILTGFGLGSERIRETAIAMLPAGETIDRRRQVSAVEQPPGLRLSAGGAAAFTAAPDDALRRLLMAAAGRALGDGRRQYGVEDVRAVIDEAPPSPGATSV